MWRAVADSSTGNGTEAVVDWAALSKSKCEELNGVLFGCDSPSYAADVFLFSCLLFLGTFIIAMSLKFFRNTRFFPNMVVSTFDHSHPTVCLHNGCALSLVSCISNCLLCMSEMAVFIILIKLVTLQHVSSRIVCKHIVCVVIILYARPALRHTLYFARIAKHVFSFCLLIAHHSCFVIHMVI